MVASIGISAPSIRVVLVDDHELIRRGVKSILHENTHMEDPRIEVVGEAADYEEAVLLLRQQQPDVAIVDIRLRDESGIEVARAAGSISPRTKVLVFSAYDHPQYVHSLARLGMAGYVLKTASAQQLKRAVYDVAEGRLVFEPSVADKVIDLLKKNGKDNRPGRRSVENLTHRETQVLEFLARGLRNSEVASSMGITLKTVEAHVEHILQKMGVNNRTQAVLTALERGWLQQKPSQQPSRDG